jgi:hypothetical protein
MPYTITKWEERPASVGGPAFSATVGDDRYRVSGINYTITAHDGDHTLHEVIVWCNGDEVAYRKGTSDALAVFHDYLESLENNNE